MKLKSGCIFWPQVFEGVERRFGPLRTDIQCEVAIIGGGVSGAFAAFYLCREGIDTVLVDRRRVGHGSTAASTGLLQYEIDTPLVELIGRIGEAKAVAAYRASLDGLMAFEPLVEELGDRCGLAARPSLYLASKESDVAELIAEGEARRAMGIDVKFMSGDALKSEWGICRPGALWSAKGFEIDPFRLTLGLMNHAIARGLRVFEGTEIARFEAKGGGVELADAESRRICARKVIFAMGYETLEMIKPRLTQMATTYAVATEKLADFSDWPQRCLIWESSRPYFYARTTADGRAIIGGEDEEITDPARGEELIAKKAERLCRKFESLFPNLKIEPSCAWAGIFASTKDGLPYIGAMRQYAHTYFALGFGGNGITFSLVAARIIRDLIRGANPAEARLFGFDR